MSNSPSKPLPPKYEIAEPQTYDFFDISAAKTSPVEPAKTPAIDSALKATQTIYGEAAERANS